MATPKLTHSIQVATTQELQRCVAGCYLQADALWQVRVSNIAIAIAQIDNAMLELASLELEARAAELTANYHHTKHF